MDDTTRGSHYIHAMGSPEGCGVRRPALKSVLRGWAIAFAVASTACGPTPPLVPDAGPIVVECDTIAPTECPDPELTYADIEPIVTARCVECHDGRSEEWPLTSYSHVADWQTDIRSRMLDCTMPPPEAGIVIETEERQLILDWLRCGLPR